MDGGSDWDEVRATTWAALRRVAAAFADRAAAPGDAGADGVAERYEPGEAADQGGTRCLVLTSRAGCPVELRIPEAELLAVDGAGLAQRLFETLIREAGAHLLERETLVLTTSGRPDAETVLAAYRRRLG